MTILDATDLRKHYGSQHRVLNGVSLSIDPGDIHVIYGRSGSGKTTLLNCLAGVDQPDSGTLTILTTNICELTDNQRADFRLNNMGILYQFFQLLPALTLFENITLPAQLTGRPYHDIAYQLATEFGIIDYVHRRPDQCSAGQCQRAALCRALICQPRLVLADEPTGNLDTDNRNQALNRFQLLANTHSVGLVLATHDDAFKSIATHTWHLQDGRLIPE